METDWWIDRPILGHSESLWFDLNCVWCSLMCRCKLGPKVWRWNCRVKVPGALDLTPSSYSLQATRRYLLSNWSNEVIIRTKFSNIVGEIMNENDKIPHSSSMIRENRQLVTDEAVEFEKKPVEVQDCRKITVHFRGIYRIYPTLLMENRRIGTCNRWD